MSNSERESLAKEHGMTVEFVDWFFDTKKEGCGNVWFMMMAAMWEGWKEQEARGAALAAENAGLKESRKNLAEFIHEELDAGYPLNMNIETPATDDFPAEVRASAIKSALNDCTECLDRDCIMDLLGISYEDAALREAGAMALHDALLRKGVQS